LLLSNYITDRSSIYVSRVIRSTIIIIMSSAFTLLQGCSEDPKPTSNATTENLRSVQISQVSDESYYMKIRFPGVTQKDNTSQLSFGVEGTVKTVLVDIGAHLNAGEKLASLDVEPYKIALDNARASAVKARATLEEYKTNYERLTRLVKNNAVSEQSLDAARSAYETARATLDEANANIRMAERNISKTVIKAPFDGIVSSRDIEPFEDVTPNQVVFSYDGMNKLVVKSSIPVDLADKILKRKDVEISVSYRGSSFNAVIEHLGQHANEGLNFPVKIRPENTHAPLLAAGLVVQVNYLIPNTEEAILVPHGALLIEPAGGKSFIYQYNEDTGLVSKSAVRIIDAVEQGYWIKHDLAQGDLFVAAGASFITDGQRVKPIAGTR